MRRQSLPSPSVISEAEFDHRQEASGLSRRDFMRLAAIATAVGATGLPFGLSACGNLSSVTDVANRPVRREITTADSATIASFKQAITWMKGLPPTDPRNWTRQAEIHNTRCRHASWLFFPWHRAYLYYFEEICRVGSGNPNFALPYWNWTLHPQIPAMFFDPASPLYDGTRLVTASDTAPSFAVGASVVNGILAQPNFLLFAGQQTVLNDPSQFGPGKGGVEETPHDTIHVWIGGDMGAFMSPLDPLFWMHHDMVDQLWVQWNILRGNNNTNNSDWWNTTFTDFVDGNGNPATITVLDTVMMPVYSYKFDTQP